MKLDNEEWKMGKYDLKLKAKPLWVSDTAQIGALGRLHKQSELWVAGWGARLFADAAAANFDFNPWVD